MTTSRSAWFGGERQRPGRVAARLQHGGVRPQLLEKGGESFADDGVIVDDEQFHGCSVSNSRRPLGKRS